MPSQTKENYLKAVHNLEQKNSKVSISALAKHLGLSLPTVNNMIKKLEDKQWVIYEKYKPIQLTDKGQKEAAKIIRKHRLVEAFLVEFMGFGWEEVHEIAEQMEHIDSEVFFNRMNEMLQFPTHDPHGSPIPNKNGELRTVLNTSLTEVSIGKTVKLVALNNSDKDFLVFLNKKKIALHDSLTVLEIEKFDDSRTIQLNNSNKIVLSKKIAENLLVEEAIS